MLYTITNSGLQNGRPTSIGSNTILVENRATYVFTLANFTTETTPEYSDPENDSLSYIEILSLPPSGTLSVDGMIVSVGDQISSGQISTGNFAYLAPDQDSGGSYDWNFDCADIGSNSLSGLDAGIITMQVSDAVNLPPDVVGDKTISLNNGNLYIFSADDFTTTTTPPYNDPEGDSPEAIKILTLPSVGVLYFDSVEVVANQIIPVSEIGSGYLIWYPFGVGGSAVDTSFNFAVSDSGSGEFSE